MEIKPTEKTLQGRYQVMLDLLCVKYLCLNKVKKSQTEHFQNPTAKS
jgi:hypothetical protein